MRLQYSPLPTRAIRKLLPKVTESLDLRYNELSEGEESLLQNKLNELYPTNLQIEIRGKNLLGTDYGPKKTLQAQKLELDESEAQGVSPSQQHYSVITGQASLSQDIHNSDESSKGDISSERNELQQIELLSEGNAAAPVDMDIETRKEEDEPEIERAKHQKLTEREPPMKRKPLMLKSSESIEIERPEDDSSNKLTQDELPVQQKPDSTKASDTSKIQEEDKTGKEITKLVPPTEQRTQMPMVQDTSMDKIQDEDESVKEIANREKPEKQKAQARNSREDKIAEEFKSGKEVVKHQPPVKQKAPPPDTPDEISRETDEIQQRELLSEEDITSLVDVDTELIEEKKDDSDNIIAKDETPVQQKTLDMKPSGSSKAALERTDVQTNEDKQDKIKSHEEIDKHKPPVIKILRTPESIEGKQQEDDLSNETAKGKQKARSTKASDSSEDKIQDKVESVREKHQPPVKLKSPTRDTPDTNKDKIQVEDKSVKEIAKNEKPVKQKAQAQIKVQRETDEMQATIYKQESELLSEQETITLVDVDAESIEDKHPEDDSEDKIAKGEPPVKEKRENTTPDSSQDDIQKRVKSGKEITKLQPVLKQESPTPNNPDFRDLIVASTLETNVMNCNGGVINIGGCKITFPEGSFTEDTTIHTKAEINSLNWPEGYTCITAMLYCKASNEMQKTASVELTSWCMHSGTDKSKKINVHVLHQSNNSKIWDTVAILPLTDRKKFQFECTDFSPYVIGISHDEISDTNFLLNGYIFTSTANNFILSFFLNHELIDGKAIVENMEKRNYTETITFNTFEIQVGDTVTGYIECKEDGFSFPEEFKNSFKIDPNFIRRPVNVTFQSPLRGNSSQMCHLLIKCGLLQNNASVDGPRYLNYEWQPIMGPKLPSPNEQTDRQETGRRSPVSAVHRDDAARASGFQSKVTAEQQHDDGSNQSNTSQKEATRGGKLSIHTDAEGVKYYIIAANSTFNLQEQATGISGAQNKETAQNSHIDRSSQSDQSPTESNEDGVQVVDNPEEQLAKLKRATKKEWIPDPSESSEDEVHEMDDPEAQLAKLKPTPKQEWVPDPSRLMPNLPQISSFFNDEKPSEQPAITGEPTHTETSEDGKIVLRITNDATHPSITGSATNPESLQLSTELQSGPLTTSQTGRPELSLQHTVSANTNGMASARDTIVTNVTYHQSSNSRDIMVVAVVVVILAVFGWWIQESLRRLRYPWE